jgi:two-component system cell cycle sensor histidine kinase/response regulator CckA
MSGPAGIELPWQVPTAAELDPELAFRLAGRTTVLIVEDDKLLRAMARRVLGGQAYRVLEAVHGADALRVANDAKGVIDVVLTDIDMPTIGVRSMLARLEILNPALRVIFMSGHSDAELLGRGFDKGYDPFLSKPFTGLELVTAVRDVVRDSAIRPRA